MPVFTLLYILGLVALLATFLPFSPLTIDLVNLSRTAQLAIYERRHALWGLALVAWSLALALGLAGRTIPTLTPVEAVGTLGLSALVFGIMFWTGYVPVVMTPPGNTRRLRGAAASARVTPDDIVLGIALDGDACAYLRDQIARPHYLLDQLGSRRLVVSYCILCNSATAFDAQLRGKALELSCVTAYNNNIIYLDRANGNFIQQIDGRVILGPDLGAALEMVPVTVTRWQDWHALHPDTALLDAPAQTWRDRLVGAMLQLLIPIGRLSRRSSPWHRVRGELDGRLGAMRFVLGVERADRVGGEPALLAQLIGPPLRAGSRLKRVVQGRLGRSGRQRGKLAIAVECHQRIDRPLPTLARTPKCLPSSRVPGPGHDS